MKHVNQTRLLLLSCCLLVFARWSGAQQNGLLTDTNRTSEPKPEVITIPAGRGAPWAASTSRRMMRPPGPVPWISWRSTPVWPAILRASGEAFTRPWPCG